MKSINLMDNDRSPHKFNKKSKKNQSPKYKNKNEY